MVVKILKLIVIFIACIPFYIFVDFISSTLITGKYDIENAFVNSTPFAVTWTAIVGYKWFKKKNERSALKKKHL